jgi:nicotinamidase-related amidase
MISFSLLRPEKTALLVIDVQRALFTKPTPIFEPSKLIQTINDLVERAHLYGVKVIYVQHANQSILQEGTEGWQFHPDLSRRKTDLVIQKTQGNTFLETRLQSELEAYGIENLLITGLVSHQCVKATSLGGLEKGYKVFLVEKGHSNYRKDAENVINQVQEVLVEAGVRLVSSEEIAFS